MFKVTSLNYVATMYETDGMIVYINITRGPGVTPLTRATIAITDQRSFRPSLSIKYNWVLYILLINIFKSRPHFLELNIELLLMFQILRFLKSVLYNIFLCEICPPKSWLHPTPKDHDLNKLESTRTNVASTITRFSDKKDFEEEVFKDGSLNIPMLKFDPTVASSYLLESWFEQRWIYTTRWHIFTHFTRLHISQLFWPIGFWEDDFWIMPTNFQ